MNRDEMLLETIIDKGSLPEDFTPQSRFESIAKSIINKEDYEEKPQSRQEELFLEIGEMIKQGGGDTPTGTINITENGTYNVASYANADVNVQPRLQEQTWYPGFYDYEVIPEQGYDGLSKVEIQGMKEYIFEIYEEDRGEGYSVIVG